MIDPVANKVLRSHGEIAWGGAASTAFWVDPREDLTVLLFTQLLPSSTYPLRSRAAPARLSGADRLTAQPCAGPSARRRRAQRPGGTS